MSITGVMSTIGAPFALDTLDAMPKLEEQLVVIDLVGRGCSSLEASYPLEQFEAEVRARGATPIRYETAPDTWAVMNGCFNVGTRAARYDAILFTHDDVTWPTFDYSSALDQAIQSDSEFGRRTPGGHLIVGAGIPSMETSLGWWTPIPDEIEFSQLVYPVSFLLYRDAFELFGGFDEEFGIWYDAQLAEEVLRRGWFFRVLKTPPVVHRSNSSYKLTNWANGWSVNPKWGKFDDNFVRKYHQPFDAPRGGCPPLVPAHNHGPERACTEHLVRGYLVGECLLPPV